MKRRLLIITALGIVAVAGARRLADALRSDAKDEPSPSARTYVLEREQLVRAPLDEVFAFFEQPENLALITPPEMHFRITSIDNLPMQPGTTIDYEIRVMRVPQRWTTEIVEYESGRRFADVQSGGPYRYWRHEHSFEAAEGGTLMRDRIEYQLPFGPLGLIGRPVVERQLRAIFDYRSEVIDRIFAPQDNPQAANSA